MGACGWYTFSQACTHAPTYHIVDFFMGVNFREWPKFAGNSKGVQHVPNSGLFSRTRLKFKHHVINKEAKMNKKSSYSEEVGQA